MFFLWEKLNFILSAKNSNSYKQLNTLLINNLFCYIVSHKSNLNKTHIVSTKATFEKKTDNLFHYVCSN